MYEEYLAIIPVRKGKKSELEKFADAIYTAVEVEDVAFSINIYILLTF